MPAPEPGLHYGVPFAEYTAWDAINSSLLKHMADCPAACFHDQHNPRPDNADFILGRAVHTLLLEPDTYALTFAVAPEVDRRTKAGKAEWLNFTHKAGSRSILTHQQAELAPRMVVSLRAHPLASRLLALPGASEVSFTWQDPETGLLCKARADRLCNLPNGMLAVLDLKTAASASPGAFSTSIANYGYHIQAGYYTWGLQTLGEPYDVFAFLVVEKEPPYLVAVYQLTSEEILAGRTTAREYLSTYARCLTTHTWPGYGFNEQSQSYVIESIARPAWARKRDEEGV